MTALPFVETVIGATSLATGSLLILLLKDRGFFSGRRRPHKPSTKAVANFSQPPVSA